MEQCFFQRWWRRLDAATQAVVRGLVASGQLEFAGGGWVMTDEAAATYTDMVLNLELGHRRILAQFGAAANPKIAWQIDPFGHAAAHQVRERYCGRRCA